MVVEPLDGGCGLLEADVIEAGEGSAADVLDGVVWDQELFLWKTKAKPFRRGRSGQTKTTTTTTGQVRVKLQRTFHLMKT